MTRKLNRLFLPFVFASPACAYALGLGQLEVRSGLNQTLDAEIELYSAAAEELAGISVGLASADAFAQSNLDRAPGLNDLTFALDTRPDGRSFIKISSKQPIREPLLNFLVQLDWPKGALVREFAVLLDPPVFMARTAAPALALPPRPAIAKLAVKPAPAPSQAPPATHAADPSAKPETTRATAAGGGTYGPVVRGETLWGIADKLRPSPSISIAEMMDALLEANPTAFFRPRPDSLYAGAVLSIPTFPGVVNESAPTPQPEASQPEQVADTAPPAEVETALAETEQAPQVRLVSPEQEEATLSEVDLTPESLVLADVDQSTASAAGTGADVAAHFRIPLREGRPQLWVADLDDLRSRIAPLVGVDDAALTAMKPPLTTAADSLPEVSPEPIAAESGAANGGIVEPTPEQRPLQPVASGQSATESEASMRSGVWDTLAKWRENPIQMALIAAGMLIASLAAALIARRRRRAQAADMAEEVQFEAIAADESDADAVAARGGSEPKTRETTAVPPKIHPTPVSIERVNLLIAVGNYREAENTVRLALAEDPANIALNVKLLDIHAANGNSAAFLEEAELLHDRIDDRADPRWLHVLDMGRELCPEDPMFGGAGNAYGESDLVVARDDRSYSSYANDPELVALDSRRVSEPASAKETADQVVAEALEGLEWHPPTRNAEAPADGGTAPHGANDKGLASDDLESHLNSLDFEIDEANGRRVVGAGTDDGEGHDERPLFDPFTGDDGHLDDDLEAHLESLNFDADAPKDNADGRREDDSKTAEPLDDGDDFVETKLDLAMAYLEMNDPVGARSLLDEVIEEGTDAQQRRAQELLRGVAA